MKNTYFDSKQQGNHKKHLISQEFVLVVKFYCKILFMCIKKQQKTTKNNKKQQKQQNMSTYVTKIIRKTFLSFCFMK